MISKRVFLIAAVLLVASATYALAQYNVYTSDYVDVTQLNINTANSRLSLEKAGVVHGSAAGGTAFSTVYGYVANASDWAYFDQGGVVSSAAVANPNKYAVGCISGAELNSVTWSGDWMMNNPVVASRYTFGTLNPTDSLMIATYFGDLDCNGVTNSDDLTAYGFLGNYVAHTFPNPGDGATWFDGDFNYDGAVDSTDLTTFLGNYQLWLHGAQPPIVTGGVATVPEPATIVMLLTAIGAALFVYAKKRV